MTRYLHGLKRKCYIIQVGDSSYTNSIWAEYDSKIRLEDSHRGHEKALINTLL